MAKTDKTGLLILGMHRSGTSALTRVLSLIGYALPKYVTGKSDGNVTGHWESALISELNESIFEELGLVWYSWGPFKLERLNTRYKIQVIDDFVDKLNAEFPNSEDFVLKDPRLCRTAPIFLKAIKNTNVSPKVIIPVRNPLEVADSLAARDNISKEQSALIWLRYILDAEFASRKHPRVFMFFDELLEFPERTLKVIFKTLNITPPTSIKDNLKEIERFLDRKIKHHSYQRGDVVLDSTMRGWVSRTFSELIKLTENQYDEVSLSKLDDIRGEFNEAAPLFETILNHNFGEQQQKINVKTQEAHEANLAIHALTSSLQVKTIEFTQKLEQLEGEVSQLSNTLLQRNQEIIDVKQEIEAKNQEIIDANQEVSAKNQEIKSLTVFHMEQVKQLEQTIEDSSAQLEDSSAQLEVSNAQLEVSNAQLRTLEETLTANQALQEDQVKHTQQAIKNYEARDLEVRHLRGVLAKEQRTVIKPALRNLRSTGGTVLRSLLPNKLVDRMAFMIPTAEQQAILKMRAKDKGTASVKPATHRQLGIIGKDKKPDIFIFAIIGWHFRTQRPQHIARELANRGHRVFYFEMDPPGTNTEIEQLGDRLYRIKLNLGDTPQIPAYSGTPTPKQEKAWLKAFYAFCDEYKATPYKNLIIQHPFWWQLARLLPPEFYTLYDCMDDISGFANSDQKLIDLEHAFLEGCDDMVVSGDTLMHKYKRYNPIQVIRNATEINHFLTPDLSKLTAEFMPKNLVKNPKKIRIGYVGAIADWFDTELLKTVARARPDVEFHFCGHISADHPHELKKEPNIHFYGEIPYEQVPAFLSQMDILTIPFKIIPIIQACDPVKFYEYSALGKPTISTPLPELKRADFLVFFAESAEDYIGRIDTAFQAKDDKDFIDDLQNFAKENTWSHRADQFHNILNTHPKISVIILAYGDPNLTNSVINSLKSNGDIYPNMEIIIVDNGSTFENIEKVRNYVSNFDDIQIIENGENLGFAAGNNVGIEAATGEYILLLNNDTFVSPGTIQAMMLHLKNNPIIGAIGPLTNNIGNEAKLPVNYATMEEMITTSRALKTGYRGRYFETNVVAYFAVMFRQRDMDAFGLLSLDYGRGMFEDDDHCNMIKSKGFICAVAEDAFIHHHLSATFSKINDVERQKLFDDNKATYESKWGKWQAHKYREDRPQSDLQFPNDDLL